MLFNLNSFLIAVSTALDYSEQEILHTTSHHSKRVAYIALRISQLLGLTQEEQFDLCSLALMHDNGLTQAFLNQRVLKKGSLKNISILEKMKDHVLISEKNVKSFPFLTDTKDVILYHHEFYNGSGFFEKSGDEIPIMSQIICCADAIDMKFDLLNATISSIDTIKNYINEQSNILFREDVSQAFLKLSSKASFWADLKDEQIIPSLENFLPKITIDISYEIIHDISTIFSNIIDSKSPFTAKHSNELMQKSQLIAKHLNFDAIHSLKFQIAANLHDLGKLAIANSILEKEAPLSSSEYETIKQHVVITDYLLEGIEGFNEIHEWASHHHERMDGSGYPFKKRASELSYEAKLLGSLDMYQALVEDRPYRKKMSHDKAITLMAEHAQKNLLDKESVRIINSVFS